MVTPTVKLGSIFGIPVGLHWSLVVILGLLTWNLSVALPGAVGPVAVAVAVTSASMLFLSVLAHEIAHSIVARHAGVRVDGITLWMLGGVARLDGEVPSARDEFRIAIAGPATSVVLAIGFGALAVVGDALAVPTVVVGGLSWLAVINGVVAVFNMIPAAPLDGGRVLAAGLWAHWHDKERAELGAARAGRVFGWALVGFGLWGFLVDPAAVGIWPALLGWFVLTAAGMERRVAELRRDLRGVTVADAMTPVDEHEPGWLTVDAFAEYVAPSTASAWVVDRWDGTQAGIVTVATLRAVPVRARSTTRVADVAVPLERLRTASPDDALARAWTRSGPRGIVAPHLVVRGGPDDAARIVGLVDPDVVEAIRQGQTSSGPHGVTL
ncbi:MAG TPA: site-2 protease family protein [Acidimicrobiia bacterium]|nr:site-2 protease family protein [Acidimicrobiia bacterium]